MEISFYMMSMDAHNGRIFYSVASNNVSFIFNIRRSVSSFEFISDWAVISERRNFSILEPNRNEYVKHYLKCSNSASAPRFV